LGDAHHQHTSYCNPTQTTDSIHATLLGLTWLIHENTERVLALVLNTAEVSGNSDLRLRRAKGSTSTAEYYTS
jgi:hypothetical protein